MKSCDKVLYRKGGTKGGLASLIAWLDLVNLASLVSRVRVGCIVELDHLRISDRIKAKMPRAAMFGIYERLSILHTHWLAKKRLLAKIVQG